MLQAEALHGARLMLEELSCSGHQPPGPVPLTQRSSSRGPLAPARGQMHFCRSWSSLSTAPWPKQRGHCDLTFCWGWALAALPPQHSWCHSSVTMHRPRQSHWRDPAESKWTSSLWEVLTSKFSGGQWKILASGRALAGLFPTRFLSAEKTAPSYSDLWLGACNVLPQHMLLEEELQEMAEPRGRVWWWCTLTSLVLATGFPV